jgi:catechol-2,3-dioxygenase
MPETKKFYDSFLGQPNFQSEERLIYNIGDTKVFFVLPKKGVYEKTDKDKSGLNHIAFGVRSVKELELFEQKLDEAAIHYNVKTDEQGHKKYIWLDDPNDTRVEIFCRPLE